MSSPEKPSGATGTFNEGEYLKDFQVIEDALEQNMRAEQQKTFGEWDEAEPPFSSIEQWVHQRLAKEEREAPEEPPVEEPPCADEVPFSSSSQETQGRALRASASSPEAVLYRQARRSQRRQRVRQGIRRFLPHIGHRRRHWLQRNAPQLLTGLLLLVAVSTFYLLRIRPRMALSALDPMAGATEAHAEGNYEKAIALYDEYLRDAPQDQLRTTLAHYYLGCCYETLGNEAKARQEYRWVEQAWERFRQQQPNTDSPSGAWVSPRRADHPIPDVFANALYSLGRLAREQDAQDEAEYYFRRLLSEFPDYFFAPEVKEYLKVDSAPEAESIAPVEGAE